jgi:hypothetical protein
MTPRDRRAHRPLLAAAMEPTGERSDDGSVNLGRLTWEYAGFRERHETASFRCFTFVLSRSEKYLVTCVRATTGV